MAGGKGKKRSSSSAHEHDVGDDHEHDVGDDQTAGPKIRKLMSTLMETRKRKGKLQIKEHDKPIDEMGKTRLLEEEEEVGENNLDPEEEVAAAPAPEEETGDTENKKKAVPQAWMVAPMPEQYVAHYKHVLEEDYEKHYITGRRALFWPGGPDAASALNDKLRRAVGIFKELAAEQLKEHEAKGYLECIVPLPPDGKLPPNCRPIDGGGN
ncbi:hypothetical protein ACP70R_005407 [Stipagrostis hirtigluma subsp. patula]